MVNRKPFKHDPLPETRADEIQMGRNYIRSGDTVKVSGPAPGKRGFRATFRHAVLNDDGTVKNVEVYGAPGQRAKAVRTFTLDRIERVAQSRNGERVERRP